MKLAVFNGSPRGEGSNTKVLMEHFINGFMKTQGNACNLAYLVRVKDVDNHVKLFQEAEHVLLAFPLYTDAMPAIVKTFIEALEPLCRRKGNPPIGFVVQSGFPEAIHSSYVERYLEKLARRLGCTYTGTVVKGGGEVIRATPALMNRRLFKSFYELGMVFGERGEFDRRIMLNFAKPERYSGLKFQIFRLAGHSLYWDKLLKKNGAFEKRFAKPYAVESSVTK